MAWFKWSRSCSKSNNKKKYIWKGFKTWKKEKGFEKNKKKSHKMYCY